MKYRWTFTLIVLLLATSLMASETGPKKPTSSDKCPVCGMFVAKYPDFLCQIIFKDGAYVVFDGAKDMFKYYLDLKKYAPSKDPSNIDSIFVTDYYSLMPTAAKDAYYVVGSNVYGPMGKELIPFEKESDANEFMADHIGMSVLKFDSISSDLIKSLD